MLDTRTGHLERTVRVGPGSMAEQVGVIGDQLYILTENPENPDGPSRQVDGYDLRTGMLLWGTEVPSYNGVFDVGDIPVFTSRGIVAQPAVGTIEGLQASDGVIAWQRHLPSGCSAGVDGRTAASALFLLPCGTRLRLISLDPATGRVLWQHDLGNTAGATTNPFGLPGPLLTTRNGDIIVQAGKSLQLYGSGGRLLFNRRESLTCAQGTTCVIGDDGADAVLLLGDTSYGYPSAVQDIDLATGRIRWQHPGKIIPADSDIAVDSAGMLYGNSGTFGAPALPAFILALQASTGRSTVMPLPTTADYVSIIGSSDGLLIAQSQGPGTTTIVTAYRPAGTPGKWSALGGTPTGEWPSACTLVTTADLRLIAPGYVAVPQHLAQGGISWPKPVTCTYATPGTTEPVITLTVSWIAATVSQAHQLTISKLDQAASLGPVTPISGGYLILNGNDTTQADEALITAGRAIVELTTPGSPGDVRKLAPLVAGRLRADYH
ncbi:MAG: PQQ-binding-like beta-propeller repeat protein [Trebonia sp.]